MIKYNAVQAEHASRAEMRAELAENGVSSNRALTGLACVAKYGEAGVDREAVKNEHVLHHYQVLQCYLS